MKWSILIPTVVTRPELFERLANRLAPQVAKYKGDVEVVVYWNNFEQQVGKIRQQMVEESKAEYVNFIDDDDLVVEDYVDTIYPLLDGVDYIGFMVDFYTNGTKVNKPVIHSLTVDRWHETESGFYRRGVHTNPVKRELAVKYGGYDGGNYDPELGRVIAEDSLYADNIGPHLKTEHYIPRPMHIYYQTDDHAWGVFKEQEGKYKRPKLPKYFRFHPGSTKDA